MGETQSLKVPGGFEPAVAFVKRQPAPGGEGIAAANSLGLGLLSSLAGEAPDKTVAVSPAGLVTALALIAPGAGGATAKALTAVLGNDPGSIGHLLGDQARRDAEDSSGAVALFAGAVWASARLVLNPDYVARLKQQGADIRAIDFTGADAITTINSWIEEHTRGLVPRAVDHLPADTIAAITSAVYFKAAWQSAFDPALTQPGTFEQSPAARLPVPMMSREGTFKYCEAARFQAVCLGFAGDAWEALVVLDRDGQDAGDEPAGLTFAPRKGTLTMPRLALKTAAELAGPLRENGLADVVSRGADFSGIGDQAFYLSAIRQSITLSADESGAEAAAATVGRFKPRIAIREKAPFTMLVNRPFLFAIRHRLTGLLLFVAKVCDPGTKTQQEKTNGR
jgi:serpin B